MTDQTLQRGFMSGTALAARTAYRTWLGAVLLVEAAAGLALLVSPLGVSRLLGLADDTATIWPRLGGVLLLLLVLHMAVGHRQPAAAKALNLLGLVSRALLGIALLLAGGCFLIPGAVWLVAAAVLAMAYFRHFQAEVMNRP